MLCWVECGGSIQRKAARGGSMGEWFEDPVTEMLGVLSEEITVIYGLQSANPLNMPVIPISYLHGSCE